MVLDKMNRAITVLRVSEANFSHRAFNKILKFFLKRFLTRLLQRCNFSIETRMNVTSWQTLKFFLQNKHFYT